MPGVFIWRLARVLSLPACLDVRYEAVGAFGRCGGRPRFQKSSSFEYRAPVRAGRSPRSNRGGRPDGMDLENPVAAHAVGDAGSQVGNERSQNAAQNQMHERTMGTKDFQQHDSNAAGDDNVHQENRQ